MQAKKQYIRSGEIKRLVIFLISFTALVITVPWFFTDFNEEIVFGFPLWALYSLSMSVLYAIIIAVLIERYWNVSAGEDEQDSKRGSL